MKENYKKSFQKIEKAHNNSEARAKDFKHQLEERKKENQALEEQLSEVHERWNIIADSRITSIPTTQKEWDYAKQVVSQPITKTWEPAKLSQTKSSMLSNNHYEPSEEELNQDFASMNDDDFDKILDDDSSSSSTGSSELISSRKPKMRIPTK